MCVYVCVQVTVSQLLPRKPTGDDVDHTATVVAITVPVVRDTQTHTHIVYMKYHPTHHADFVSASEAAQGSPACCALFAYVDMARMECVCVCVFCLCVCVCVCVDCGGSECDSHIGHSPTSARATRS